MSSARDRDTGRFLTRQPRDPVALYDVVRDVALAAADASAQPFDPALITQRLWNQAKRSLPGYTAMPNANEICRQLGAPGPPLPWRHVLTVALDPERSSERVHTALTATEDDDTVGEERIFFSLNRVVRFLGQKTLSTVDYSTGRERMIERDRRRRNGGALEQQLLTVGQILRFTNDSWPGACTIAGLPVHEQPRRQAVPVIDAGIRYSQATGYLPSYVHLEQFARGRFSLERRPRNRSWLTVVEEIAARIREQGLPEPPPYDPRRNPAWDGTDPTASEDDPPPRKDKLSDAELTVWAARFLGQLGAGERPTVAAWRAFEKKAGAPNYSVVRRRGGLAELVKRAGRKGAVEKARAEVARQAAPTPERLAQRERDKWLRKAESPSAQQALQVIRRLGEAAPGEIARELGINTNSLTPHIRALRTAGLIEPTSPIISPRTRYRIPGTNAGTPSQEEAQALLREATGAPARRVYRELELLGEATVVQLAARTGLSKASMRNRLRALVSTGFVTSESRGVRGGGHVIVYRPSGKPLPES